MMRRIWLLVAIVVSHAALASAQTAPPPPEGWTGSLAAGLALTGGNTQTTTTNFAFTLQSDKARRNVVKAEGLNIRSSRDGEAIVDRTSLQGEDDYALTARTYVFGRLQYLRDVFKSIDYLVSPTGGVGYKVIDTPATTLVAEGAVGVVTERNPGLEVRTSGAITAGEKASHKLSGTATVTESLTTLWKTADFGDALTTFQAGLAMNITPRTQFKVDFLDTYKNRPPSVLVKKNDTALILSFVFRF